MIMVGGRADQNSEIVKERASLSLLFERHEVGVKMKTRIH